jgi:TolB-like protein
MNETQETKPEIDEKQSPGRASLWSELKRRHVIRVAGVYCVVAWLVIQVAGATFESFGIPLWAFRFVVLMVILGLPVSMVIAWALELTPEGVKRIGEGVQPAPNTAESARHNKKRRWWSMGFAAAVPTLIFGTLALIFYLRQGGQPSGDPSARPLSAVKSIAVLPLVNMSEIDANAFFAGGVHEDILTNLSRINGLKVISRTSVMRFINSEMSMREIGLALGADYIVEGSVRRINNHVRVTVQLIDASTDVHLWANNYDRELMDVFATQSAVAREICNSLHLEIQPESVGTLQGMPTHSVKAYDLYLKARSIDRSELPSGDSLTRQRELLEGALREDPDFVEAWAVLNEVYDASLEIMDREEWPVPPGSDLQTIYNEYFGESVRALKKAAALNPENLETLIARASGVVGEEHLHSNMSKVEEVSSLRRTMMDTILEKYPDSAMAWYISGWWHFLNASDIESAATEMKKALDLDPLHAHIVQGSWAFYRLAADEEMVAMLYDRLTQIAPEKGSEQHLGKVSLPQKLSALIFQFALTADQSLIEPMDALRSSPEFDTLDPIVAATMSMRILTLKNDQSGLKKLPLASFLEADYVFDEQTLSGIRHSYLTLMSVLLSQERETGIPEQSAQRAERILQRLNELPASLQSEHAQRLAVEAYVTLGRQDKAWALVNKMLDKEQGIPSPAVEFALALLDPDQAAARILKLRELHPSWNGMDYTAIYCLGWKDVVIHPDVQAYYVKEGKWIDYLAERLPEYEQYRK